MRNLTPIFFATLLFSITHVAAQPDYCFSNASGTLVPVGTAQKFYFTAGDNAYVSEFTLDTVRRFHHVYFREIEHYAQGSRKIHLWREEKGNIFRYNPEAYREELIISARTKPGTSWLVNETLRHTIEDTASSLSTPFCDFTGLLRIRAERTGTVVDTSFLFFKRGVGLVGKVHQGRPALYITPDPATVREKSARMPGCETISDEAEAQECNFARISEHITRTFQRPRGRIRKGEIVLNVVIGKDGQVQEVYPITTIDGAEAQEAEAIRVMHSLPPLTPAQVNEGVFISYAFKVPFRF